MFNETLYMKHEKEDKDIPFSEYYVCDFYVMKHFSLLGICDTTFSSPLKRKYPI